MMDASELPEKAREVDAMRDIVVVCEVTKKPFRIIKQEIVFYQKHDLPLPRRHPDQRHTERMQLRNPWKLWERSCVRCGEGIQTSYAPERKEEVLCGACYNKEVYG